MDWDIRAIFPLEIWEKIVTFCDGQTLLVLSRMNKTFDNIIISLNERRNIWENRCYEEIPENDRVDTRYRLYPNISFFLPWNSIYQVWFKWKNLSKGTFEVFKIPKKYLHITDIKVSNEMIVVADYTGFAILDYTTCEHKRFKIGPVKHLELLFKRASTKRPEGSKFLHDVLDCSIGKYHLFFELHRMIHLRCDKHENQLLRYYFGKKKAKFVPPILEADIFEDMILIVSDTCIRQAIEPMNVISQYVYSWEGARCWFLWHARLLFCAKDDTLDIYLNGRMKKFPYGAHHRTSAIFYFGSMLFLGSIHGSLYIFRIKAEDIFSFDFDKYELTLNVCSNAIIAIDIVKNNSKNSFIIVATDYEIYRIFWKTNIPTSIAL